MYTVRAMMRDENYYLDPDTFNPDRFVPSSEDEVKAGRSDTMDGEGGEDLNIHVAAADPIAIVYGFGRR